MEKQIDQSYSFSPIVGKIENTIFVNCQFIQSQFNDAQIKNCLFIACNFSMASMDKSQWERCTFQACEFVHTNFDSSNFVECSGNMSNFSSADLGRSNFGFIITDHCNFSQIKLDDIEYLPAACRELVGEVIRQSSDRPQIQAFSALVKTCTDHCWETLINMGKFFLNEEDTMIVRSSLQQYKNFDKLLDKFYNNKGLLYSKS